MSSINEDVQKLLFLFVLINTFNICNTTVVLNAE